MGLSKDNLSALYRGEKEGNYDCLNLIFHLEDEKIR